MIAMTVVVMLMRWSVTITARHSLRGGKHQPAGLDSLGADQVVSQVTDLAGRAAQ